MFTKWSSDGGSVKTEGNGHNVNGQKENIEEPVKQDFSEETVVKPAAAKVAAPGVNKILKGSKLTGDINVTCDLELSGDVEGNIKSLQDSNIVIKGTCKGNIETAGGSVDIEGELKSGNIIAGSNVKITGKFSEGDVKAKGTIYVNGEFTGKLEGNDIEIGSNARGSGELLYKESISIAKGAKVEVRISHLQEGLKVVKNGPEKKVVDLKPPLKEKQEAK